MIELLLGKRNLDIAARRYLVRSLPTCVMIADKWGKVAGKMRFRGARGGRERRGVAEKVQAFAEWRARSMTMGASWGELGR